MADKKINQRWTFKNRLSRCLVPVASLIWIIWVRTAFAAPASLDEQASKIALDAYCTEAKKRIETTGAGTNFVRSYSRDG